MIKVVFSLSWLIAAAVMGDKLLDLALANSNSSFPGELHCHLYCYFFKNNLQLLRYSLISLLHASLINAVLVTSFISLQ